MKLCKDCKHAALPNAMQYPTVYSVSYPMCGHPSAERGVAYGELRTSCTDARGAGFSVTDKSICWPDVKLFEERPPVVADESEAPIVEQTHVHRISFIDRIVDRLFFR